MDWSLYNKDGFLEPYKFSNDKTQLEIVEEVIEAVKEGNKIIFIKGSCGSGKSAIALNIAKELGKTSIVVPVKGLQKQYEDDYTNNLYILKNNKKLNIKIISGRQNHKCLYKTCNADDKDLPCKIEIKEKNFFLIKEYLEKNPFVKKEDFETIEQVRRKSIAPACPYWSPIICNEWFEKYKIEDATPIEYQGLNDKTFTIHQRKKGCGFYNQYNNYLNADVIIFNSKMYELENTMDRKPSTEVEIIDECDEFLDKLTNEKTINLERLSRTLVNIKEKEIKELTEEMNDLTREIINDFSLDNEIYLLKNTKMFKLLKYFSENPSLVDATEDESDYFYTIYQIAESFKNFLDETYITFHKNNNENVIITLITINLEKKLKEILDKNKVFIMMSGTIHSEEVLKNIFGIKDFKIIEAETEDMGEVTKVRVGKEQFFTYNTLKQKGAREKYLKALNECIETAEKPVLIHVKAYNDLPKAFECSQYNINIKTKDELIDEQEKDKKGELIKNFKEGKIDVLYSTKCTRGVDFPGKVCNSIIFTKFPYPNISSLFWRVLRRSKPEYFNMFYMDKAKRDLLQMVYRGLRSEDDHINVLSPDLRVLNSFGN